MMGSSQAGKAPGFGPGIRRFESCLPSFSITTTVKIQFTLGV